MWPSGCSAGRSNWPSFSEGRDVLILHGQWGAKPKPCRFQSRTVPEYPTCALNPCASLLLAYRENKTQARCGNRTCTASRSRATRGGARRSCPGWASGRGSAAGPAPLGGARGSRETGLGDTGLGDRAGGTGKWGHTELGDTGMGDTERAVQSRGASRAAARAPGAEVREERQGKGGGLS